MLIALVSAKGAPGVTTSTLAMALTWPRAVVLAECDPRGGDVLAGFAAGRVPADRGLVELQIRGRNNTMANELPSQLVQLPGTSQVQYLLPGIESAQQAGAIDWDQLAGVFRRLHDERQVDVLADCGEVHAQHSPTPILRAADLVVLVARTTMPAVRVAVKAAAALRADLQNNGMGADRLVALLVSSPHGYSKDEIGKQLDLPVLGEIPWHETAARVLSEGADMRDRYLHSKLVKAASDAGQRAGTWAWQHYSEADAMRRSAQPITNGYPVPTMTGERRGR
jgi:MinD-like ATPase involved in chromosome partitioning or flagellar assembly